MHSSLVSTICLPRLVAMIEAVTGRNAIDHAALSDVGLRRANNQDWFVVALAGNASDWGRRGHLFMVADGMSGSPAGELASKMACET